MPRQPRPRPEKTETERNEGDGWKLVRRRSRHGALEVVRSHVEADPATPEGLGLVFAHRSAPGPLEGVECALQQMLASWGFPPYRVDWAAPDRDPDFAAHPALGLDNEAHPARRAAEALAALARARRCEMLAMLAPGRAADLIGDALNEAVRGAYLAGELVASEWLERLVRAGEPSVESGRRRARERRELNERFAREVAAHLRKGDLLKVALGNAAATFPELAGLDQAALEKRYQRGRRIIDTKK